MKKSMTESKKISSFFIPSIADIFFISLFLLLSFSAGKDLLGDVDTGYHIRAGEYIIDTFSIPRNDIFSFLSPPLPWTAHEWLSEVVMAIIYRALGLTGVVLFFSFIISMVYYLLYKIIKTNEDNLILTVFILLLILISSQIHWLARPHIFSLVLILVWYFMLDLYQYKQRNYLYLLPPLMLLWVNLHGGFLAGFLLVGIYLFGNVVKFITSQVAEKNNFKKKVKLLGLTTAVCLFVSLINPFGYQILLFPFKLVSNKFIMDHVGEFLSPNFHEFMPFKYLLLLMLAIFAISKRKINIIELLLILAFTNMSLYSVRYIPLFGIISAPILLRQFRPILNQSDGRLAIFIKKRSESISATDASAKGYLWPALSVVLVVILAANGTIEFEFNAKTKPVAAVEFMKIENLQGNMFNNDEFGDYIIYDSWPKYKVFVDGRSDMYGVDIMKEYLNVIRINPDWNEIVNKYNFNWIIYNANSSLSMFLMERDDWKLIYADKVANIFVKNIPENQHWIQKYPDVELVIEEDDEE
jgi:hypothetical protein